MRAGYSIDCTEDLCPYDNVTYTCMFIDVPFVKWNIDFGYKTSSVAFTTTSSENGTIFNNIEPFVFQFIIYDSTEGTTTSNFTVVPEINGTSVTCVDDLPFGSAVGTGCSISIKSIQVFTH